MGTGIIVRTGSYLRRLLRYIGPGFMIAVGYLDPGNWSVDMEGGSRFGYTLLFVILVSNVIAIFLQNLAIRLGTVSGLDLAAASRHHLPRPLNLFLYVISEIGIIMTDLAEVIGSAIALTLLFPSISLPMGVAITALDVLIILLFYKEDQDGQHDMRFVHYFEWFVMALVSAVGICFIIELTFSPVVMSDVMRGFLPSSDIFLDKDCLYVAIGIIGATVMPHNLFLHSFIVQSRCYEWRSQRPLDDSEIVTESALAPTLDSSSDTLFADDDDYKDDDHHMLKTQEQWEEEEEGDDTIRMTALPKMKVDDDDDENDSTMVMIDERHNKRTIDQVRQELEEHVGNSLHYGLMDLVVALCFAFFINAAILIVASANFHHEDSATVMSDLFDAHGLLRQYIGPVAAFVFAIALLCAGQSSTLTATLAGQVVMSGFLGMTTRPWLRRLLTRLIAIVPAMAAACLAGRSGLSQMLVASQVALSIQLPFAVIPLVYFTSSATIMKLDVIQSSNNNNNNNDTKPSFFRTMLYKLGYVDKDQEQEQPFLTQKQEEVLTFANGWMTNVCAYLITLLLLCLNIYLVLSTLFP